MPVEPAGWLCAHGKPGTSARVGGLARARAARRGGARATRRGRGDLGTPACVGGLARAWAARRGRTRTAPRGRTRTAPCGRGRLCAGEAAPERLHTFHAARCMHAAAVAQQHARPARTALLYAVRRVCHPIHPSHPQTCEAPHATRQDEGARMCSSQSGQQAAS